MRIILFTGKGGVGKTTIAAATALLTTEFGHKTLAISTDTAHSLGDSLNIELTDRPKKIKNNLYAQEINPQKEIEKNWGKIQEQIIATLNWKGFDEILSDEISVMPGMDELFSLIEVKKHVNSGLFDTIIIDCAPTASTLRLLSFPEIGRWYMKNIFQIEKGVIKAIRPIAKRLTKMPIPTNEVFDSIKNIYENVDAINDILIDNNISSVRLVINPEKMVIKEAQRAFTYLNLFGYSVDSVIANRIIPEAVKDPYFEKWKKTQVLHMEEINEIFSPLPIFLAHLYDQEIVGLDLLIKIGKNVYGEKDPAQNFYKGKPVEVKRIAPRNYTLSVKVPFLKKEELSIVQKDEELAIKAGNYKRNLILPQTLKKLVAQGAEFKEDTLVIKFMPESKEIS